MMTTIEQKVMAGVGVVYAVRQLFSLTALKLYVCVVCLWGIGQLVWVAKVFENMPQGGVVRFAEFAFSAVTHTDLLVQLVLLVGALAFVSLLIDLVRPTSARVFA